MHLYRPAIIHIFFFFSSRRRHTRFDCDWSSDVCSSDLGESEAAKVAVRNIRKDVNEAIKRLQKEGLPEDEAKSAETQVQKNTDTYIKKIDEDRKSTRLNSSHSQISYAVFCLKKKKKKKK